MNNTYHSVILAVALLVSACHSVHESSTAQSRLMNASSINFSDAFIVTDGGSEGIIFKTDMGDDLVILIPISSDMNDITNSTQSIYIYPKSDCINDDRYILPKESVVERHLIGLLKQAQKAEPNLANAHANTIALIESRNCDWRIEKNDLKHH